MYSKYLFGMMASTSEKMVMRMAALVIDLVKRRVRQVEDTPCMGIPRETFTPTIMLRTIMDCKKEEEG